MQKIITHLWFDNQAEAAATFYVSLFNNSRMLHVARYSKAAAEMSGQPEGSALTVLFELDGQRFMALNGGPHFTLSEAVSLVVNCNDQEEVDRLSEKLSAGGGSIQQCGWLKDRYGLSWQIIPTVLATLMSDANPAKSGAVMTALMQMTKLDIRQLQQAYDRA